MIFNSLHRPLTWVGVDENHIVDAARTRLDESGIVRIAGFPAEPRRFLDFLGEFGTPLRYYGDSPGTHPDDAVIWRIHYEQAAAERGQAHAIDGPLTPHSSQSLRNPRPPYFSMLMVDKGWDHLPPGQNGESVLVRWADAFRRLQRQQPRQYASIIDRLDATMPYPGSHEDLSVIYPLESPADEFDIGVRFKSNLAEHLRAAGAQPDVIAAVKHLAEAARAAARVVALDSRDLLLLDNDRWGHGRESVLGCETRRGRIVFNPRELWSVTVA
jgi:hypothetical protein